MTEMSCGKSHAAAPNVSVSGTMIANARRVCSCTRCDPRSYTAHCASVASAMHDAWPAKNTSLIRTELSVPCVALRWLTGTSGHGPHAGVFPFPALLCAI